jgi:fructose-1,6-bisphosphatase/inositol monophosphatase family enzyme
VLSKETYSAEEESTIKRNKRKLKREKEKKKNRASGSVGWLCKATDAASTL